jgi:cation diffusion facilitator CzcD-associated flavoprotein CzcO
MESNQSLPVAIIGAGPVGLAAAAHLSLRNQPFILLEAGATVASHLLAWGHVRVFSPWRYNVDQAARTLLEAASWAAPDAEGFPTGQELYEQYLRPLAELPRLRPFVHFNSRVMAIGRKNTDKLKTAGRSALPFVIRVQQEGGELYEFEAKAVIDASGTWATPNPVGSGGLAAAGEQEHQDRIVHGIPDLLGRDQVRYRNQSVLVVGGGHSAINAVLDLAQLKQAYPETQIHWVLRKRRIEDVFGGQASDALPARGALGTRIEQLVEQDQVNVYTPFQIEQIRELDGRLAVVGNQHGKQGAIRGIDEIISATGSRPDFSFLREVRLNIDPVVESTAALADLIDPNVHSCGTVRPHGELELRHPDAGFYIVGAKSYGRAPTFLMATGYEQVRSTVAALAGDWEAARKVELELPQTGVCSSDAGARCCAPALVGAEASAAVCCG